MHCNPYIDIYTFYAYVSVYDNSDPTATEGTNSFYFNSIYIQLYFNLVVAKVISINLAWSRNRLKNVIAASAALHKPLFSFLGVSELNIGLLYFLLFSWWTTF